MQGAADSARSNVAAAQTTILDAMQEAKQSNSEADAQAQKEADDITAETRAKTDQNIDAAVAGTKDTYEGIRQATAVALKGAADKLETY